jgi:hypothetical protein
MGRVDAVAQSAGEWEVKVFFAEDPPYYEAAFEVRGIPTRKMTKFLKIVAENREALYAEWDRKVKVVDP